MSRTPPFLVTLLVLGALVACGDDGGAAPPGPGSDTTTGPEATTTTAVDPFTIPDDPEEITVEYVEAVLTELERINGDALRLAVEEGVTADVALLLESVFIGQPLVDRANVLLNMSQDSFDGAVPGDVTVTVGSLAAANTDCIAADATEDFRTVTPTGVPAVEVRIELVRGDTNPTGWVVSLRHLAVDGPAGEPCVGS